MNMEVIITRMSHVLIAFGVANVLESLMRTSAAPYGRYSSAKAGLSPNFAWFIQESPSVLVPLGILLWGNCPTPLIRINNVLFAVFLVHYIHRAFIYPFYLHNGKPSMWSVVFSAIFFCSFNGFLQGYYLMCIAKYPPSYYKTAPFLIGLLLFVVGMTVNIRSDYTLVHLRKPEETDYKIPKGGLFEYVSCANYFGEIVEWWGYALATGAYPAVAFAVFTTLFLGMRSTHHHRFYLQKIKDYPRNRKAIIPFLF